MNIKCIGLIPDSCKNPIMNKIDNITTKGIKKGLLLSFLLNYINKATLRGIYFL
jgi:hypothetical protein